MMQTFKDSVTGEFYQLNDDVVVRILSGVYTFETAGGDSLTLLPKTLQPATMPVLTDADILASKRAAAIMTPMAFELAVDAAGLTPQIEAYLADPATPNTFIIMWKRASSFDRMNADLITAATSIGLTDAQMDAVFGIV